MDSFIKERLQQWNLCDLIETFQEEGVDEESFMLLDEVSIAALIPRIGLRVKFSKFHSELLGSLDHRPVNNQSFRNQSPIRNDPPTPTQTAVESCQARTTNNSNFDIREILIKSGGLALTTSLDGDGHLSLKERRKMVRLLVSHLMERFGENPSAEIKKEMALALTAQFPCLKNNEGHGYESWYTPGRYRHPATGYLEERLRNVRKRLRAPHSQRRHSHPQPSHNFSSRPSFQLPESELSLTEIHTMIDWLKNNRTPHSQVEEFMRRTAPHRAAWIRSSGTKTVEEINREYPRLHNFPGMISQDFGVLFPDNAERLYEFWAPVFTDRILLFARKEPKASDVLLESLETLTNDIRGEIAFKTLPAVLPSSPYRTNGKMVRPTYTEMKRSFIDVQPVGTNMVQYLHNETSQDPHVLVLGDKGNSSQVFIIFNGEAVEKETLLQAVDVCFKMFYIYDINYPKPSAPIWEFLQHAVYNIPGGVPSTHCRLLKNFVFNVTDHQ
ncbi:hypothetical protein ABG768_003289 [Culter alburnus]|uniref:Uncharacterized protein n=1 Tax=Culter alburnus TaxID=194366 RepID=A0AAW1ZZB9_CULAL